MLDFLRWLDAFDPEKDIGEAIPEAASKVRCLDEGLTFSRGGTSVFRLQELNQTERPVVDLPVARQLVTVTRYGKDRFDILGTKEQTRLVYQSEIGAPVGSPDPAYHTAKTAAERALIRAKGEAFKTAQPESCPWQGALIGFWHAAQRVVNYNIKDNQLKEANTNLIVETGEMLKKLTRTVGDNESVIVRRACRRLSSASNPLRMLRIIKGIAERWVKRAGNDEELIAQEAKSCMEEFLDEAKISHAEFQRYGAMLNPSTGKLVHMRNVVHERRVQGENGELIRLGYADDGEMGQILSADEIYDLEEAKAEAHLDERVADRIAINAGRGMTPIPILLDSDVHRPQRYAESDEIVGIFNLTVVNRENNTKLTLTIEGEHKAKHAKNHFDRLWPKFMATGIVQVGEFRRTFGGFWSEQPDGSFMKAHGIAPSMQPKDMSAVDHLGILRDFQPDSGFTQDDLGCYVEQSGGCTVILAPDWVTMNVEFGDMHDMIARISNLTSKDVQSYEDRQQIHKDISVAFMGRNDKQRYLRGMLRARIQTLREEQGWTPKMADAIKPLLSCGLDTFHIVRGKVGHELASLSNPERSVAWAFINALREELRAEALKAREKDPQIYCDSIDLLIDQIRIATIETVGMVRRAVQVCIVTKPSHIVFLLNDELLLRRAQLKIKN